MLVYPSLRFSLFLFITSFYSVAVATIQTDDLCG
jgi:hypothetical protein